MKAFSFFIALSLVFVGCTSDENSRQEADLKKISDLGEEIIALVDAAVCEENSECTAIGFGSKPCGGPSSYLIYPTSIDVDLLTSKVEEYNEMSQEYNERYGLISDCLFLSPPTNLICEDGKCKAA